MLSSEVTLKEALSQMKEMNSNFAIFVNKENKPIGIITERDILKIYSTRPELSMPAFDYAKKEIIKIRECMPLFYALNLMIENFIRRLIVIDKEGKLIGVIDQKNIFKKLEEDFFKAEARIKNLIEEKKEFYYLAEEATLEEAVKVMAEHNIGVLPILDKDKKPLGIISERDFINITPEKFSKPVLMFASKPVITIKYNEPVSAAIKLFKHYDIRHLVVVDEEGRALNVISQRDYFYMFPENYFKTLETKCKHIKNFLVHLPEIVIEVVEEEKKFLISWANKKALEVLGTQIIGKEITELIDLEDWINILGILNRFEFVYKQKARSSFFKKIFEVTGCYVENVPEKLVKIKLFLRDITKDHHERQEFFKELSFIKSLLNNSLDFIFVIDPSNGKFVFVNTAFLRTLGYSEEELQKKTIFDIVQLSREELRKNIEILIRKREAIEGIRYYKDKWEQLIPVEIKANAIEFNNKNYIIVNGREISKYFNLTQKVKHFQLFFDYINYLTMASTEEEIFDIFEKFILRMVDGFHYYEFDKDNFKLIKEVKAGKTDLWERCLNTDIGPCKVFKTGAIFEKKENSVCLQAKVKPGVNYICFPVFTNGNITSIIFFASLEPLEELTKKFLQRYVQIFNAYLNNIRLYHLTRELSIKDPLTGIYNRRFIYEAFEKEIAKYKRLKKCFSIVIIDLDNFKKVNDTYGHLAGDKVLSEIALLLKSELRAMDFIGRLGGEEFLVIFSETPKKEAFLIANRLREKISSHPIYLSSGEKIFVTASFGIAECPSDGEDIDTLLAIADKRLYKAKALGKNLVVAL